MKYAPMYIRDGQRIHTLDNVELVEPGRFYKFEIAKTENFKSVSLAKKRSAELQKKNGGMGMGAVRTMASIKRGG